MKSATLANAALCLCPPLLMATAVTTVPRVRHAVHKATAPHHQQHKPTKKAASRHGPCAAGALPAPIFAGLPVADNERPLEIARLDDPGLSSPSFAHSPVGGMRFGGGGPGSRITPNPLAGAVPEPADWLMMLSGFFMIGMLLRRRRADGKPRKALHASIAAVAELAGSAKLILSHAAVTAAHPGSVVTSGMGVALAKKAALCVCSGALVAGAIMTIPPVKRAVFHATMPFHALQTTNCPAS